MGSKVQKQAEQNGFIKFRKTTLYARPRKFRSTFSKVVPDTADIIRDYINLQDPSFIQDSSGGARNTSHYYLSTTAQIYVEVISKIAGFAAVDPSNHAIQINIYCNNEDHMRGIAKAVNNLYEDGILAHMDWKKIEKKYKVRAEDCITEWKTWL